MLARPRRHPTKRNHQPSSDRVTDLIMERTPVTSKNIQSIGYDPETQTLEIEFNTGGVYQYAGVPEGEYEAMMNADSKGKYLIANIKGRYSYTKL